MTINSKKTFTPFKAINIKDVKDSKNKELFKTYKDKDSNTSERQKHPHKPASAIKELPEAHLTRLGNLFDNLSGLQ
jgi:hypothetical protein